MDKDRQQRIDALYEKYALTRGGSLRRRLRYRLKTGLWKLFIGTGYFLKRLIDVTGSAAGLIMLSPLFLLTALAIRIEDSGPVLFRQTRVGRLGKTFGMYKFRSMVQNAEKLMDSLKDKNESGGVIFKMKKDPRITRVGAIIRKLSIDELPQLWNVLKGDMSLVGPRPAIPSEVEKYTPDERRRLEIKPGITCLWQIGGRSNLDFQQQVQLDVLYIESQSFTRDILILFKTIPAVVLGKGAY